MDAASAGDCVLIKADTSSFYPDRSRRCITDCDGGMKASAWAVLFPKSGVTVRGEDSGPRPILSGLNSNRSVAWVDGTRNASIERLTIREGGIFFRGRFDTTCVVRDCVITDCMEIEGAGLRINGPAAPLIENNLFLGNHTTPIGHHKNGAAIGLLGSIPAETAIIRGNIFRDNQADRSGGAIRNKAASPLIVGNLFENNRAGTEGGAIVIQGGKPIITGNIFRGDRTKSFGGAIAIAKKFGFRGVKIRNNLFVGEQAAAGGAIYVSHGGGWGARMEIVGNTFVDCRAESLGSMVYIDGPQLERQLLFVNRNIVADSGDDDAPFIVSRASGVGIDIDSLACNRFWRAGRDSFPGWDSPVDALGANGWGDPGFAAGDTLYRPADAAAVCGEAVGARIP